MNKEYLDYANKVDEVGSKIIEINDTYYKKAINDFKNGDDILDSFKQGSNEYCKCADMLKNISPPAIILQEHNMLVNELNKFSETDKAIWNNFSLDGNAQTVIDKLVSKHKDITNNIVQITTTIGDILISN